MSARLTVIFYIILCLEVGLVLTLLPWIPHGFLGLSDWGDNYFLLYAAQNDGLVTLSDGTPARRERLNYIDTITWKDPRTNASVRWSVPREEVRVVPVNFQ